MGKITSEMRAKLREPLPPEAVSPHPTKTYLSTIKSIYVAERINDVFGVGSWTLKGEPVEMGDKNIVMKVILEIPDYDFYGEAYGGNDNPDRGDAFKGAVTDGLTKIAAQQLEIGIAVFKGLTTGKKAPAVVNKTHTPTSAKQQPPKAKSEPSGATTAPTPPFKNPGEFYTACNKVYGLNKTKVDAEIVGMDLEDEGQRATAWAAIAAVHGEQ